MKNIIFIKILFLTMFINAQSVKVKKGEILLDKEKIGTLEKIKIKGVNSYYIIKDNKDNAIFKAKLVVEHSKLFGKKTHTYYIIDCLTVKDTIGIENLGFYLGEKRIAKYLVKNNLLDKNGVNSSKMAELLSSTTSKPSFFLKKIEKENELIKNIHYKVKRDLKNPLFVVQKKTVYSWSRMDEKTVNQTKYEIYQGVNSGNKSFIGFAFIEISDAGKKLIITNSRESPIAYFNNFSYYTFYPLEKIELKSRLGMKRLDTPIEAVYEFSQMLIEKGKL